MVLSCWASPSFKWCKAHCESTATHANVQERDRLKGLGVQEVSSAHPLEVATKAASFESGIFRPASCFFTWHQGLMPCGPSSAVTLLSSSLTLTVARRRLPPVDCRPPTLRFVVQGGAKQHKRFQILSSLYSLAVGTPARARFNDIEMFKPEMVYSWLALRDLGLRHAGGLKGPSPQRFVAFVAGYGN